MLMAKPNFGIQYLMFQIREINPFDITISRRPGLLETRSSCNTVSDFHMAFIGPIGAHAEKVD